MQAYCLNCAPAPPRAACPPGTSCPDGPAPWGAVRARPCPPEGPALPILPCTRLYPPIRLDGAGASVVSPGRPPGGAGAAGDRMSPGPGGPPMGGNDALLLAGITVASFVLAFYGAAVGLILGHLRLPLLLY